MKNNYNLHTLCLDMLDKFITVCEKYELAWFADSGTLLGAIRKGKIIDWDDDIDVIMPRADYNRLLAIGQKEFTSPYFFQTPMTDYVFSVHAKIRYDGTTFLTEQEYLGSHHKGVFIDIFPLDAVPDDKQVVEDMTGFLRLIGRRSNIRFAGQSDYYDKTNINFSETFKVMNDIITDITNQNQDSLYVGNVMFYRYSDFIGVKFSRKAYEKYSLVDFEGLQHKLRVPVGYEEILTAWYGDDWRVEKQVNSFHSTSFYDLYNNYSVYENINEEQFKNYVRLKRNMI